MSLFLMIAAHTLLVPTTQPAHHRVVIEVNVPGTIAYGIVLNNAANLIKAFAPEKVEIEIVCHGNGMDLLLPAKKDLAEKVRRAQAQGVVFAACSNTLRGRQLTKKDLYPFAVVVDSGVAEIVRKQEAGWSYLKGAY